MPIGGLNYVNDTMSFPDTDAYVLDNAIPRTFGLEIRKGWRYWVPEVSKFSGAVRSILVHNDEIDIYSALFASPASDGNIYDITTQGAIPVLGLTPSTPSDVPGEWYSCNFTNEAGNVMCVVSAGAGYYTYSVDDLGVKTWSEKVIGAGAGFIQFPPGDTTTTKDFCFIWVWKNRIWFLKKNSSVAYYLPLLSLTGLVTAFDFGQQLSRGGALAFGANWTYDAGNGIDDSFVVVSEQGEVLIYQGTDPDQAAEFQIKGRWYMGRPPYGRRGFCENGGDLFFLSEYGLVRASDLVSGRLNTTDMTGGPGFKINPMLSTRVSQFNNNLYWSLTPYPTEEIIVMGTPILTEIEDLRIHLVMNVINSAWCTISQFPILSAKLWRGKFIFGSELGEVAQGFVGAADGVSADGTLAGDPVTARFQTGFNAYNAPNFNKRMLRIKLYGLAASDPTYFARFRSEYDLSSFITAPSPTGAETSLWDIAIWDQNLWGSGGGSFRQWFGALGWGKKLSLQMAVRGSSRTTLTDYESLFETGIGL